MDSIKKETFQRMPIDSKLEVMFDVMTNHYESVEEISGKLDRLESIVQRRKRIDTTVASMFGFVGGAVAYISQRLLKF